MGLISNFTYSLKILGTYLLAGISLFHTFISIETLKKINIIGHIRGWKKIKHPTTLALLLSGKKEKELYGYKLADDTTHKIVLLIFCLDCLAFFCLLAFYISFIYLFINKIEWYVLYIIDVFLYTPFIIRKHVVHHIFTKEYNSYHEED